MDNKYGYTEIFVPDVEVNDGEIISLGNTSIEFKSTPGHTLGAMSLFFEITEGENVYRCGMLGGGGFVTMSNDFLLKYNIPFTIREDFLNSLNRLENEKVDITLGNHPFHNDTWEKYDKLIKSDRKENPFINSKEWKEFINYTKKEFLDFLKAEENKSKNNLK